MRFLTVLLGFCLGAAAPASAQSVSLSPAAEAPLAEISRCAEIANQAPNPPGAAVLAQLDACLTGVFPDLDPLPPEDQYNLTLIAFSQLPCFGFGPQKDRIIQRAIRAARALGDFDAAIVAMFNRGVCYWNDTPANFERALQNFAPFRDALAPYINPRWLDSPALIQEQAFIFREAARRYIRFLENAYRVDRARGGTICGRQTNVCLNDAWTLTQRVKARLFHSRILQVYAANDRSGRLSDLLARQYRATQAREAVRLGIAFSTTGEEPGAIADDASIEAALAQQFPEYSRLYESLSPSLEELRSSLRDDEVYISYLFTDEARRMMAFRVTKRDPPVFIRLPVVPAELKERIAAVGNAVADRAPRAELEPILRQLGADLIDPLAIPAGARIIVEADEELSAVPFALAISASGQLGASHEITYVPSAGVFRNLRRTPSHAANDLYLGFGRMSFPGRPPPNDYLGAVNEELTGAAAAFGANAVISEPEAHESMIYQRREALARAHVLHLATHTDLRDGEVALVFHDGEGEDGRLTETDIVARLRTSADLVILSACDTATLNQYGVPGEAFSGLTRAFFASGARKLLVTQWRVQDRFAGPLIAAFMRDYAAHGNAPRALAEAQATVRAMPEASEWDVAGWILVGD